jgi:hypothetical protein
MLRTADSFFSRGGRLTMNNRVVGGSLAVLLLVGCTAANETFKSGPQVGDDIPGVFHPLNVTGPNAGEKFCQI